MQDEPALLVEVAVEEVERRVVVLAHDGPAVATVGLAHVRLEVRLDAELVLVSAECFSRQTCSKNVANPSLSHPSYQARHVT